MNQINNGTINFKSELLRKSIHFCSLSIPILYYSISKETALKILLPLTIVTVLIDYGRYYIKPLNQFISKVFGFLLREHEMDSVKKNLNGAAYVFIGATISILIFPKLLFITAFSILIICDIAAALFGRKYGKNKFLAKSLEGTLAFFISACIIVLITPKYDMLPMEYLIGFIGGAVGAIIENISYGWADDNLTIPLSIGFTMWGLYYLLLPNIVLQ